MAKKPEESKASQRKRRQRVKVSAKEALKRMQAFGKRREKFRFFGISQSEKLL